MRERDPYLKPAAARDAALSLVRAAVVRGENLEALMTGGAGIYRPDYNAVVGRL